MLSMKVVFALSLALTVVSAQYGVPGGVTPLSGAELEQATSVLNYSLTKLAAGAEGPNYTYDSKTTRPMHVLITPLFLQIGKNCYS